MGARGWLGSAGGTATSWGRASATGSSTTPFFLRGFFAPFSAGGAGDLDPLPSAAAARRDGLFDEGTAVGVEAGAGPMRASVFCDGTPSGARG